MTAVRNCNIPDDLYYLVRNHVWAKRDGDLVVCGITDVAQNLAKSFIAFSPKAVGKTVQKAKSTATLESGKWVGPVPSPVTGEIVEVNPTGQSDPTIFNRDPYGDGWVCKIRPEDWDRDAADLLTGAAAVEAYEQFMAEEGIECGD